MKLAILLLSLLVIISCADEDENSVNFGPESNCNDIDNAKQLQKPSLKQNSLLKGEFSHRVNTLEYHAGDGPTTEILSQTLIEVFDRISDESQTLVTLVNQQVVYGGEESFKKTTEEQLLVDNSFFEQEIAQSHRVKPETILHPLGTSDLSESCQLKADYSEFNGQKLTYHNLKTESIQYALDPETRAAQQLCPSSSSKCEIPAFRVEYDIVLWDSDTEAQRIHFEKITSDSAPLLAYELSNCISGVGRIQEIPFFSKDCITTIDFAFGSEAEP